MSWWHYLLLVNFYLVLFFAFYAVLLRKETFFNLNRIFLVSATVLSFLIPLVQASWVKNLFITQQVQHTLYVAYSMPITIYGQPVEKLVTIGEILGYLYVGIAVLLIIKLLWSLLILKKQIEKQDPSVAYSFFKKISLGKDMANADVIAEHEQVHARQWHSVDVLLIELAVIINWFNPVVYLYRFAIKYIHEFIADREVLKTGTDKADYALLLLTQTFDVPNHHLASNFYNTSLLKQRIAMLQKNRSNRIALIKYGLSAPLFMLMLILSSATVNDSTVLKTISKKAENVFLTPASATAAMLTDLPKELPSVITPADRTVEPYNKNTITEAQDDVIIPIASVILVDTPKVRSTSNRVYDIVEILPSFPGGSTAFNEYLAKNLRYPAEDRENDLQGKVILQFTVETDGSLTDIRSVRAPSQAMAAEAIRVVQASPKWRPGIQNGRQVRSQFTQQIAFTLNNDRPAASTGKVYEVVQVLPSFPGGIPAFSRYLAMNIRYPAEDRENNLQGKVILQFTVEIDGSITDIRSVRAPSQAMAAEAIRVVKASPAWTPGMQDGKAVRSQFTQQVSFTLGEGRPTAPTGSDVVTDAFNGALKGGSNSPLIVVDGVALSSGLQVDQSDIETMTILRPTTAKQLYGDKAANGAVVLTTKSKKGLNTKKTSDLPAPKK